MATQIKLRRDTAANWENTNPTLASGEPGYDTTNKILKIGNGTTAWLSLPSIYDPSTNIVPSLDNTYDLGSPDKQWRHVYTAGGSIYLDNIKLTNVNGKFTATTVINPGTENEEPDPEDSDATSEISGGINLDQYGNFYTNNFLASGAGLTGYGGNVFVRTSRPTAQSTLDFVFSESGTLTVPNLFPVTFTATVDPAHYYGEGSLTLTGDAWSFEVTFAALSNGTIETQITNNTPWPSNPGYSNGLEFRFMTTDHGIPDYTFTLTLTDIQNPGPMVYTTNLAASVPPTLPSAISSLETIKLTADATSWTFSPDGNITLPGGAKITHNGTSVDLVAGGEGYAELASNNGDNYVRVDNNGAYIVTNNNGSSKQWTFSETGTLTLPEPSNINFNDPSIRFGGATSVATNNYGFGVPGPAAGVVYTATTIDLASMKLLITIEGNEDGGDNLSHTQVCEMLVVRRTGLSVNTIDSVVYGVIHTSTSPLAVITAQESVDGRVEILAQPTNSTPIYVKVHATEIVRGD